MTTSSPSADPERIGALDLIRGVAILGILPANMPWFSGTGPTGIFGTGTRDANSADQVVKGLTLALVDGKMVSQLAILFGAGLALQADRAWRAGRPFTLGYLWRTLLLFVLGSLHALLLWDGDILMIYACLSVAAVVCVRFRPIGLLSTAIAGLTWSAGTLAAALALSLVFGWSVREDKDKPPPGAIAAPASVSTAFSEAIHAPPDEQKERWKRVEREFTVFFSTANQDRIYREGSYGEQLFNRVFGILGLPVILFFIWGELLACFLFGALLVRVGFFSSTDVYRRWRPGLLVGGLAIGIPMHVASLIFAYAGNYSFLSSLPHMGGAIAIAVVYLTLLTGWEQTARALWLQDRLKAVGRLALTNYLSQTVICTTIFYSFGFGLYARLGRPATLLVVLGVWTVQLIVSPLYLRWFRIGPVEWVWRCLAQCRVLPLRRREYAEAQPAWVEPAASVPADMHVSLDATQPRPDGETGGGDGIRLSVPEWERRIEEGEGRDAR
jgi:uncharacterized protein